jgi:hypothetical protein
MKTKKQSNDLVWVRQPDDVYPAGWRHLEERAKLGAFSLMVDTCTEDERWTGFCRGVCATRDYCTAEEAKEALIRGVRRVLKDALSRLDGKRC